MTRWHVPFRIATRSRARGLAAAAGIVAGIVVWLVLTLAGLGALLAAGDLQRGQHPRRVPDLDGRVRREGGRAPVALRRRVAASA